MAYSNCIWYNGGTAPGRNPEQKNGRCGYEYPQKIWLAVAIFAALALLTGLPEVARGIAARGVWAVNHGRVGFPLLLLLWAGVMYRRS